jgi:hypothetical protein
MSKYKHVEEFRKLAEKVSEILDQGDEEKLLEHIQILLDYNENNREAITAECRDIDSKKKENT